MPNYKYECEACEYTFDIYQSLDEDGLKVCPKCKKHKLYRVIGSGISTCIKLQPRDYKEMFATDYEGARERLIDSRKNWT